MADDAPIFWSGSMREVRERNDARAKFRALGPDKTVRFEHEGERVSFFVPHAMRDKMQIVPLLKPGFLEPGLLALAGRLIRPGDVLERNIALNALENVTAHRVAVGEAPGRARLGRVRGDNSGTASFVPDDGSTDATDGGGSVPVARLDDLTEGPVGFVKIDVEGMQMPVLRGAQGLLAAHRPALWIELREARGEAEAPVAFLSALGYRAARVGPRDFFFQAGPG